MKTLILFAGLVIAPMLLAEDPKREALLDDLVDCLGEVFRAELDPTVSNKAFQGLVKRCRAIASQLKPPLVPGERGIESSLDELDSMAESHAELLADPKANLTEEELDGSYHKAAVRELTGIVNRLRKGVRETAVPYSEFQLDVWRLLATRHYSKPVTFRELGTSRLEIKRLVAEKRRHTKYRNDWRDREVDAYLTTTEPDFVR